MTLPEFWEIPATRLADLRPSPSALARRFTQSYLLDRRPALLLSAKPRARLRCGCAYGHMRGVTVVRIRERAEQAKTVNFHLPLDP